jgi:hypothetical protein
MTLPLRKIRTREAHCGRLAANYRSEELQIDWHDDKEASFD